MTRLRVGRVTVTSGIDCLTVGIKSFAVASRNDFIYLMKSVFVLLISISLLSSPVFAAPSSSLGIFTFADRAHVGAGQASVGATVFIVDRLSTEHSVSVQVRTRAASFLRSCASTISCFLDR